jgi:triacylglycerol esterase/lipase EstA (alpha/beta hydrolase family)
MSPLRKLCVAVGVFGATMALPSAALSASAASTSRAAQAEPRLTTAASKMAAALHCSGNLRTGRTEPVLLIHGTSATGREAWVSPNDFASILRDRGFPTCYVNLPNYALGKIQTSAEYVVAAVRTMSARAKRPIAIYAHSQGGLLMRWALTYWPSLRSNVADAVSVSGNQHGTTGGRLESVLNELCADPGCPPSFLQQKVKSRLMAALNDGRDETPGPTAWTTIRTSNDDIVNPVAGSALKGATNVLIQAVCPGRQASHDDARYDSVSLAALIDALRHSGPAKTSRFSKNVCDAPYAPGLNADTITASQQQASKDSVTRVLAYKSSVTKEPAVPAYAR